MPNVESVGRWFRGKINIEMNRSPSLRYAAALFAIFSLLFAQLAVAAYACPNLGSAQYSEAVQGAMAMSPDCQQLDMEQPSLCHAHEQAGNQSLDKPQAPAVPAFIAAALVQTVLPIDAVFPPDSLTPRPLYLTRATDPPISIRNCCFRI